MTEKKTLPRRDVLRGLAASGVLAAVGGSVGAPGAYAAAEIPRRGGRIRVASVSSSTADTLDPAKGALSTDYARLNMLYSGLTQFDSALSAQPALAEEIHDSGRILWTIKLRSGVQFHVGGESRGDGQLIGLGHRSQRHVTGAQAQVEQRPERMSHVPERTEDDARRGLVDRLPGRLR